jgi:hypothetical protein
MSGPDLSEAAVALNRQRWGDRVLRRSAATVLERADPAVLADATRADLQRLAGKPERDGDDAR